MAAAAGQRGLADGAEREDAQNRRERFPGCFHRRSLRGNAILFPTNAFILVGADLESRINV
jgi:hypothetical protein